MAHSPLLTVDDHQPARTWLLVNKSAVVLTAPTSTGNLTPRHWNRLTRGESTRGGLAFGAAVLAGMNGAVMSIAAFAFSSPMLGLGAALLAATTVGLGVFGSWRTVHNPESRALANKSVRIVTFNPRARNLAEYLRGYTNQDARLIFRDIKPQVTELARLLKQTSGMTNALPDSLHSDTVIAIHTLAWDAATLVDYHARISQEILTHARNKGDHLDTFDGYISGDAELDSARIVVIDTLNTIFTQMRDLITALKAAFDASTAASLNEKRRALIESTVIDIDLIARRAEQPELANMPTLLNAYTTRLVELTNVSPTREVGHVT